MKHRRKFLHLAAGVAALPVVSNIARAQTYPWRPVRIIVGFTAHWQPVAAYPLTDHCQFDILQVDAG
jgi:hypothetical protein